MRTGKGRVDLAGVGDVISVGQTNVRPGDLIIGDSDGVVAVPSQRADEVLELVKEIAVAERRIRAAVDDGSPLAAARHEFHYFNLQSPR
jgi:regulator of RNase E activity RraA